MAINNVNTTSEEKSYKFLKNQSSILRTVSTNNITINGVNVIVAKPKVGDIMCVTRYKNDSDVLLPAEEQKVIWIDGLSIVPEQLSTEFEPVGICVVVNGDKAIVRYKEEFNAGWIATERYAITNTSFLNKIISITIKLDNNYETRIESSPINEEQFVNELNRKFNEYSNSSYFTAEYVQPNTKNNPSSEYSLFINVSDRHSIQLIDNNNSGNNIYMLHTIYDENYFPNSIFFQYGNNGFKNNSTITGINLNPYTCYAVAYNELKNVSNAKTDITNINTLVKKTDFENSSYCDILRNTFASYDDYVESLIVKYPCGARLPFDNTTSGKDNTCKLANYTFLNEGQQKPLYTAAYLASSIDVKGPNLTTGSWWVPSPDELSQIMANITYGTSLWDTNPDIVNTVIEKVNNGIAKINEENNEDINSWSILHPYGCRQSANKWTSFKNYTGYMMFYDSYNSTLNDNNYFSLFSNFTVTPITIYDI